MKIYFCGSMTGDRSKQKNYEEIINYLKNYGTILNDFVADKTVTDYEPEYVFNRDSNNMKNADVVVADISIPSTGVGFELGYFYHLEKPVLTVYDSSYKLPTSLVRGADTFTVKSYSSIEEEKEIINKFIEGKSKNR